MQYSDILLIFYSKEEENYTKNYYISFLFRQFVTLIYWFENMSLDVKIYKGIKTELKHLIACVGSY